MTLILTFSTLAVPHLLLSPVFESPHITKPKQKLQPICQMQYLNSVLPYYTEGQVPVSQWCPELAQASLFLLVNVDPMNLSKFGLIFKPQKCLNTTHQGLCLCVCARG